MEDIIGYGLLLIFSPLGQTADSENSTLQRYIYCTYVYTFTVVMPNVSLLVLPMATSQLEAEGVIYSVVLAEVNETLNFTCTFNGGPLFELLLNNTAIISTENGGLVRGEVNMSVIENGTTKEIQVVTAQIWNCLAVVDEMNFVSNPVIVASEFAYSL